MHVIPQTPVGIDYSGIVLLNFLLEKIENSDFSNNFKTTDFSKYLYRFYADNDHLRTKHYHKMIQNIYHYSPDDFLGYSKDILNFIESNYNIIETHYDDFSFKLSSETLKNASGIESLKKVISLMLSKYLGFSKYREKIEKIEFENCIFFDYRTRVFKRVLERRNFCFICDEANISNLCAVRFCEKKDIFDASEYILLCKEHAQELIEKKLSIRRNGYAFIGEKRTPYHIDIAELKQIRCNLE